MQKLKTSQSLSNLVGLDSTQQSASSAEYKWFKVAVKQAHSTVVPPSDGRVKLDTLVGRVSTGFCISLAAVDGLKNTKEKVFSPATTQIRLQLSLFDSGCKQFLGRTWIGPEISYKDGGKLPYNQTVYFHSSLNDPGILLVFEIVVLTETGDGQKQMFGGGWGVYKIFKPDVKTVDLSDNTPAPAKKIEIYHGSPRALLYVTGEIEGNPNFVRAGYQVLCAIQVHRLLLKVIHLFPENVIVGQRETIPGLVGGQKDPKSRVSDNLRRPRLAKALQCSLERITVRLNPSLEKFEEELCRQVLDEYILREQPTSTGKGIQVTKRFLRVGVHNGWTFVAQPEEIQLNPSSESVNLNKSASFKRGHQRSASTGVAISAATGLVHKSRVDIEGLLQDAMFHVVFSLVYEFLVPSTERSELTAAKTSLAQPVLANVVCWGAVSPLASADSSLLTVQLFGGNLANPDSTFVYRSGHGSKVTDSNASLSKISANAPSGTVTFTFNREPEMTSQPSPDLRYNESQQPLPSNQVSSRSLVSVTTEDGDLLRQVDGTTGKPPISGSTRIGSKRHLQQSEVSPRQPYEPQGYPLPYLPFPQAYMHGMMLSARDAMGVSSEMHELPYSPIHFPILATVPGMRSGQSLSRAAYAKLHSVGFPPILTRVGTAAEAVDPSDFLNFVMAKEAADRLKVNEITLQFMAFSRLSGVEPYTGSKHPSTVFFTFQFYRFEQVTSERLLLGVLENDLSGDKDSLPFILQRFDKDGTLFKGPPGYQVKYVVDPVYMRDGESQLFVKYLAEQTLHIDVWDGDSLLLIGSSIVELRHLCRQGREAVQVSYELDVVTTEYIEHEMVASGDVTRDGSILPTEVNTLLKGRLHLRLGNVGHPLDSKLNKTKTALHMKTGRQVICMDDLPKTLEELYKTRICKAQHLADLSQELAQLLRTRRSKSSGEDSQSLPAEKLKKLTRMEAVRQAEKLEDTAPTMTFRKEKDERYRDLKTMELFRTHGKRDNILNMLNLAITTEHVVYASLGSTEFFEFVLKNPYNVEVIVSIEWTDIDLEVITNPIEWRHFKMINEIHTPLEEGMFNTESKSGRPEIFLRAKETVHVPFKFLTFKANHSVEPPMPSDPYKQFHQTENQNSKNREQHNSRVIKVFFRNPELKPLAILSIKIEHQPHIIDQTFRLSHPEQTFLKKSFRLPPLHSFTDLPVGGPPVNQVFVRCSDCNVICETRKVQPGEPHDIFMKVACGASPQVKRFYVAMYVDPYLSSPIQIWQVYIQAMQRVDVAAIQGQTSRFTLVLRGTQTSRLVQCFTSHLLEMQILPKDAFVLPANSLQEIQVGVRPVQVGCKNVFINVVDTEFHQLVRSWLISVISRHPVINKSFELMIPVGGGKGSNKKISFTNPYGLRKVFFVRTNRDDLLQLKEQRLELGPAETASIGLRFCPSMAPGYTEILVFINDEDDKNEETFCVKASYQ